MKNYKFLVVIPLALTLLGSTVKAQSVGSAAARPVSKPAPAFEGGPVTRPTGPITVQQRIQNAKQAIEASKQAFERQLQEKKAQMESTAKAKKDELQKKLQSVKDSKKQAAIQRIVEALEKLNKVQIENFKKNLEQLNVVLGKIETRTLKAEASGKDVSSVKTAINNAKNKIEAAKTAITLQAAKTYVGTITSEPQLKADMSGPRQQLEKDLKVVKTALMDAREAVSKAANTLGQVPGVDSAEGTLDTSPAPKTTTQDGSQGQTGNQTPAAN